MKIAHVSSITLQLVRSNSRRLMPSQADEEAHQLSYLQKHLPNILSLLAESVEEEGEESLVSNFWRLSSVKSVCYFNVFHFFIFLKVVINYDDGGEIGIINTGG